MPDDFDIGPLTWVKDDINQSLDSVLESVEALSANPQDTSGLRFSQTHLYQASGALDMVGLEGCKLFCNRLENLVVKLEKKELDVNSDLTALIIKAVNTLKYYIQALLNGSADIPLRLYSALKPLVEATGETIDESELFFPDTSNTLPAEVESKEFSEEEYITFIAQQRLQYQKALLKWIQAKDSDALTAMHEALSNVALAQHKPNVKTLWWAASAFAETLNLSEISDNVAAKKLCRKLDQELRQLTVGESKANPDLLRDILYFIAICDTDKENVLKVKEVFSLEGMVDKNTSQQDDILLSGESELGLVADFRSTLEKLRDIWESVSSSIDFEKTGSSASNALVDLDNVLITKFTDKLNETKELTKGLSKRAVTGLYDGLSEVSAMLRDDKSKATHAALIEVASALHLLDSATTNYQNLDADTIEHLQSETRVLNAIVTGVELDQTEGRLISGLDKETITAVVNDVNASLKVIEQSLDTYFRNPEDKSTLSLVATPIQQIKSIFDMLSLPTPTQIVQACANLVQYFQQDDYVVNQADFELLAESLSMVGLYSEEMPNVRPESTEALEGALERLDSALALTGVAFEKGEIETLTPTEVIKEVEKQNINNVPAEQVSSEDKILDKAHDEELLDIYLTEAEEVLAQIAQNLQALRVNATDVEPLVDVRRSYHTLKGSGRTVGLAGQAEVAAKVEIFLNGIVDNIETLNAEQITKLEKITETFAVWAAELKANNSVSIDQAFWLSEADALSTIDSSEATGKEDADKEQEAYVLIGGKRKLSRQLYEIFLNESMQNLTVLEQDVAKLTENKTTIPEKEANRAVHTLASNALAAGFTPLGELSRALERWLDEAAHNWTPEDLTLYSNVTEAIAKMWQAASEQKTPRAKRSLIKLLNEASEKISQNKEASEVMDALSSEEDHEENKEPIIEEVLDVATEDAMVEEIAATKLETDFTNNRINTKDVNPELLEMFTEEANEILPEIGIELRAWKSKPKSKEHAEALQRSLHTIKGSARMASQAEIGTIAHELEEFILGISKKTPADNDFDVMFLELDKMSSYFDTKVEVVGEDGAATLEDEDALHIARGTDRKSQFLRMRAEMLDQLINEAGEVSIIRSRIDREMVGFKQFSNDLTDSLVRLRSYLRELEIEAETQMQSRMSILQEANESFDPLEFDRFTRLQELTRMIAESVNDVGTIQTGLLSNLGQTEAALQQQNRMNRELQQGLLGVRMLPFQQISERMQRIVRQTARELNKSVDLVINGEGTEIDRSILDRISAPLEHLLRNSVAHGIEAKNIRKANGKSESGSINISIQTVNDEIHIVVTDDGAGVDLEKVKQIAINKKLLEATADITEDALLSVIFEPGFSTAADVSQIAGRGVGLDVVRNDISGLGGRIDMATEAGKGAKFNIYLPVTQSVTQVLVVRAGENTYALPVAMIVQAQKVKHNDLMAAYADGKITWGDVNYPLHHLARLLGNQEHQLDDLPYSSIILLRSGEHMVALHVDEVIGNQEVVMKEIGTQLARVPGIVGATVTGDGRIVLILNPVQIANREVLSVKNVSAKTVKTKAKKEVRKSRALVVDDSLTMRKVLGRLLERDGYEVQVAKDGMDAMELLQTSTPDIILTDIEMPRMDGFGLARNIRDDERTTNTPLIMISSRTADKHQNMAKEIGVDAFFGKPVQDEELVTKMNALLKRKK